MKGQYLTYQEYKGLGGTLDLTPFNISEFEARRRIDEITHNRLIGQEIPEEVKLCEFRIIEMIKEYSEIARGKNSETVGSYSVSYADATNIVNDKNIEIDDMITTCLYGVIVNGEHLIYCGV